MGGNRQITRKRVSQEEKHATLFNAKKGSIKSKQKNHCFCRKRFPPFLHQHDNIRSGKPQRWIETNRGYFRERRNLLAK